MIDKILEKNECCGCFVCENTCPKECIEMVGDIEGFKYPNVDYKKCIECKMCVKICPALNRDDKKCTLNNPEVIASYTKDEELRITSTSGGIFTEIAKQTIINSGKVYGAKYNKEFLVEHGSATTLKELEELKQSKYLQSDLLKEYCKVKKDLLKGIDVVFAGTPCHILALKNFLGKEYSNLLTVDFLCRGVISPDAYSEYLKSLEKKYDSKVKKIIFKEKTFGWHRFSTKILFENGETYLKDRYNDLYMRGYLEGALYIRPSCYKCKYKTLPRYSDITLGDFWGIEKIKKDLDQDKGTSIFMINTKKGINRFNDIKERLIYEKMEVKDIYLGNSALTVSAFLSKKNAKKRKKFFLEYKNRDFIELVESLLEKNTLEKNVIYIKKIIKKVLK